MPSASTSSPSPVTHGASWAGKPSRSFTAATGRRWSYTAPTNWPSTGTAKPQSSSSNTRSTAERSAPGTPTTTTLSPSSRSRTARSHTGVTTSTRSPYSTPSAGPNTTSEYGRSRPSHPQTVASVGPEGSHRAARLSGSPAVNPTKAQAEAAGVSVRRPAANASSNTSTSQDAAPVPAGSPCAPRLHPRGHPGG